MYVHQTHVVSDSDDEVFLHLRAAQTEPARASRSWGWTPRSLGGVGRSGEEGGALGIRCTSLWGVSE